jgi:hypothetical protein
MKLLRDNGLTIVLVLVTLACVAGMIIAGLGVEKAHQPWSEGHRCGPIHPVRGFHLGAF